MKKNVMMRVASIMLVLVLMTSSVISGTFAKYTTQDAGSDEARVAKWGVELQVFGNLYGDAYVDRIVRDTTDTGTNIRVKSIDNADVVAPGTENAEGFEISLRGKPEVDGIITTTIVTQNIFLSKGTYGVMVPVNSTTITEDNFDEIKEVALGELYKYTGSAFEPATAYEAAYVDQYYTLEDAVTISDNYYPVVYNMTGNTPASGAITADSLYNVANEIAKKLNVTMGTADDKHITTSTGTKTFDSNTDLAGYGLDKQLITWSWDFDWDNCGSLEGDKAGNLCKADTILGNLIAKREGMTDLYVVEKNGDNYQAVSPENYCLDTQFSIDITVTQVD